MRSKPATAAGAKKVFISTPKVLTSADQLLMILSFPRGCFRKRKVQPKTGDPSMATTKNPAAKKPAAKKPAMKKAGAKSTAKKAAKPAVKRTPNAAFMKPMTPSDVLSAVVGAKPLPRTQVVKKVWDYIKKNNLQDATNKRMIKADENLREVFGKDKVSMFEMTKLINQHLS
jgi:upstream activation factor subunit UAF30